MSTPISDRHVRAGSRKGLPALLFAAALVLTGGCLPDLQGIETGQEGAKAKPTLSGLLRPRGVAPLKEARLASGQIVIQGPAGYCIDGGSLRSGGKRQFALLAQCDLLRSGEVSGVNSLSVLTASVVQIDGDTPLPSADSLVASFGPAPMMFYSVESGIAMVQLGAGGDHATDLADPVHWRGVMHLNGHAVGLAAYSTPGGAATTMQGRNLLMRFADKIRAASESGAKAELATQNETPPETDAASDKND